jgi:hypothetical protein
MFLQLIQVGAARNVGTGLRRGGVVRRSADRAGAARLKPGSDDPGLFV